MNTNNQVPTDWREFLLGDLLNFSNGINAEKSAYGHGVPFANVFEVITNEALRVNDIPGLISLPKQVLSRYRVRRGDLLFNRTSETQDEVGLSSVYLDDAPIVFGGFVFRGRPTSSEMDVDFSKYVLRSQAVREQIIARGQGGIRANIGQRDLRSVRVQLPERTEQRAIAVVLDDASRLIRRLEQTIAKKQAIKQGMMQQLLTGRTRLPGFAATWREVALEDIARVDPEVLSAGTDPGTLLDYISLEDVERGELLGHTRVPFGFAPSRARRVIRDSDVLFGTVRPNLQSHTIYYGGLKRPIASTGFAVVRAKVGRSDPLYLFYVLMSYLTTVQIDRIIAGSNYPAVSSGDVRRLTFAAPSLDEQRAIGSALADCDGELSVLKRRLAKARAVKIGMMQQLLTGRTRLPVKEGAA